MILFRPTSPSRTRRRARRPSGRLTTGAAALALTLGLCAPAPLYAQRPSADVRVPDDAHFVASSQGRVYYWVGCDAWRGLAPGNLVWFEAREEAEGRGYAPSRSRGCAGPADPRLLEVEPAPARADTAQESRPIPPAMNLGTCAVAQVVDGDTVGCADGRRIRLLLIDAPEMDQGPFGMVARRVLEELLPVGTRVTLERDVELHDRYGRTLAYLYLPDGRIVNEELLRAGVAVVSVYPPNVQHVERFRRAVEEAREAGRGLWATEAFECRPADHRAGRCGGERQATRERGRPGPSGGGEDPGQGNPETGKHVLSIQRVVLSDETRAPVRVEDRRRAGFWIEHPYDPDAGVQVVENPLLKALSLVQIRGREDLDDELGESR